MLNLTDLFETFKTNVFPEMLAELATSLGVSIHALNTLGVGFYPLEQAWVFAERDHTGKIIGLLKRYRNNKKVMVENSRRGLYFVPRFTKTSILTDYIRVSDARKINPNVICPVCGKPDWCLLWRENFEDPSFVICQRIQAGSVKKIGDAGYFHIRKGTQPISKIQNPLLSLNKPTLIVEGATDVLAAIDLKYDAVGKPSAEGGIDLLCKLLAGRDVIVVGENDKQIHKSCNGRGCSQCKSTGYLEPGKDGMEMTVAKLKKICKSVTKILPPLDIKDFRKWVQQGLTDTDFEKWIKEQGSSIIDSNILPNPTPLGVANQWLQETKIENGYLILRHHQGLFWKYVNGCYREVEVDFLVQQLYHFLEHKYFFNKDGKRELFVADKQKLEKILHALISTTQILNGKNTVEPFIIYGSQTKIQFSRSGCVVFKNGILDIKTKEFIPLCPDFFMTSTLPYEYDPEVNCPLWKNVVGEWFGRDKESELLLAQWFGYNLIASNRFEKMMLFYGPPASGKSTATYILETLLGPDRCIALDFSDMDYSFGMNALVGKYAAILSEDQTTRRMDSGHILQRIKRITGENLISIKRKFKDTISTSLFVRMTYETNELPRMIDNPQALRRRLLILNFINSFENAPDLQLRQKLATEIQGIVNWALKGLESLLNKKCFVEPKLSEESKHELLLMTSPIAAMVEECCTFDNPKSFTPTDFLYDLHRAWFEENGYALYNRTWFGRVLQVAVPRIRRFRPLVSGHQTWCYQGIEITSEAYERYLKRPK